MTKRDMVGAVCGACKKSMKPFGDNTGTPTALWFECPVCHTTVVFNPSPANTETEVYRVTEKK